MSTIRSLTADWATLMVREVFGVDHQNRDQDRPQDPVVEPEPWLLLVEHHH